MASNLPAVTATILAVLTVVCGAELLVNPGFESGSFTGWDCSGSTCTVGSSTKRSGQYGVVTTQRTETWEGPGQYITNSLTCGQPSYHASGWVKLLADVGAQRLLLTAQFTFTDNTNDWANIAYHDGAKFSDGWIYMDGSFSWPSNGKTVQSVRVYFEGPAAGVNFALDDASVVAETCLCDVPPAGTGTQLLQNGGFESLTLTGWDCGGFTCTLSTTHKVSGLRGVVASQRTAGWQGPSQYITNKMNCGQHGYYGSGWIKLLTNSGSQYIKMTAEFKYTDNTYIWTTVNDRSAQFSDGWVKLSGPFVRPPSTKTIDTVRVYFEGPGAGVDFAVDDASVVAETCQCQLYPSPEEVIEQQRKSNINFQVTAGAGRDRSKVQIRIRQLKNSFPFGSAINAWKYNDNAAQEKYRDFIHNHFNWAVIENNLKWDQVEPVQGQVDYSRALQTINGLRSHGIKVRGHNLVWSVEEFIQPWVKALSGQALRNAVSTHIASIMGATRGLLEHWDVNNENLHGTWYQDRLNDPGYNLELFRIGRSNDPNIKLFLNEYDVVANGRLTQAYLQQALQFKNANVGLYGLGAQGHFGDEEAPDPIGIKERLYRLAQSGLPVWITELDVMAANENTRADYYEAALRAMYGHPAVEGILMWGFWDQAHWRGEKASLVKGDNLTVTAAGTRVLNLWENEWRTNTDRVLSQAGNYFTVRGFHGDYRVQVYYNGQEIQSARKYFTLGKQPLTVQLNF